MRKILFVSLLLAALPMAANAATAKKPAAAHKKPIAGAHKKSVAKKPAVAAQGSDNQVGQVARFNMTQDGKKMTADDFDKWYQAQQAQATQSAPAATAAAQ